MMFCLKSKRKDLFFHHSLCLIVFASSIIQKTNGYMANIILIAEAMSLISGMDKMFLEDKDYEKSSYCKKYRLFIIRYFRLPIWIISIVATLYHSHSLPRITWWIYLSTAFTMILLDRYWENKCIKAIKKYEKSIHIK